MNLDMDLSSIQEARDLVQKAAQAQKTFARFTQAEVDRVLEKMAAAGREAAEKLARMAVEETGFGVYEDKVIKNLFAAADVYEFIKPLKTVGVIGEDPSRKVVEIAEPMGVVAGIVPSTNPTSTVIYKSLIALKSRNAVVFSPHPSATGCSGEAAAIMHRAAVAAGAPEGIIGCISRSTPQGTDALMHHPLVGVILATGGSAMVRAAYSAGKPAYGVGPGNVPAFIERSAEIRDAVRRILASKTFDNGTICASEQAVVVEECIRQQVIDEFKAQGGYFLSGAEAKKLESVVVLARGGLNPAIVGRSAAKIARMAGLNVPEGTRVLLVEPGGVGHAFPLSMEKLSPILAFYTEPDWQAACQRCIEILEFGGIGHTLSIHSRDQRIIMEFAMKKPVFRILVNTSSSQGAIGATTGLSPALTLGCGAWGGSITSDNVTPLHLINIKRLAYGIREAAGQNPGEIGGRRPREAAGRSVSEPLAISREEIDDIVNRVLKQLAVKP